MLDKKNSPINRQKSPTKRFLSIIGLFMFALYFALGVIIIFWKGFPIPLTTTYRILFGLLLIVYSFIRFRRLWKNRMDEV